MELENKLDQLFARIAKLEGTVKVLKVRVGELEDENRILKDKLKKKNSSNSSIPPSKDENRIRPIQSLRKKTDRKSGGQKGHKGTHLKMEDNPTTIIKHKSNYCIGCGDELNVDQELVSKRQVINLPSMQAEVIEHRQYKIECKCGVINKPAFPKEASRPISYGNSLETMIGY